MMVLMLDLSLTQVLGFVVEQEIDVCPCKEVCGDAFEVKRPETTSKTCVQAESESAEAVEVKDRCEKLLEMLGLNSTTVGDLTTEGLRQLQDLRIIKMCLL